MKFLGPCSACGKVMRTYPSLAQHLRWQKDEEHQSLREEYRAWKSSVRSLRCRKCGEVWQTTDSSSGHCKRCPRCQNLRDTMSKRQYEALRFDKAPDVRPRSTIRSRWTGAPVLVLGKEYEAIDDLFDAVLEAVESDGIVVAKERLGLPYTTVRRVCEQAWGVDGYQQRMEDTRQRNIEKAGETRRETWANMAPEEKAERLSAWHVRMNKLEGLFLDQMKRAGVGEETIRHSVWKSIAVGPEGSKEPREADFSLAVGDGRKILVFCDGEAFHGPRAHFNDPETKTEDDTRTAEVFFGMGYSAVRYSESEIHSGWAIAHLVRTLGRLEKSGRVLRLWHPQKEVVEF